MEQSASPAFPPTLLAGSDASPNHCVFRDDACGVWLFHADAIAFMDRLASQYPDGIFDMVFADPPYFLSNGGMTCQSGKIAKVDKGRWDKSNGPERNHEFNTAWLSRCQKLLKPDGTIWVSGTHHVIHSVGFAMQQLGMKLLNDITWEKPNPPPNLSCRYFTHSTETLLWAAKNEKSRHRFNYGTMREINHGRQMKSVWTLTAPNGDEKAFGKHPTQKPVALMERIILACTSEGDLILDPFAGSSTTGVAAIPLQRRYVGLELDASFVDLSAKRLETALLDLARPQSRVEATSRNPGNRPPHA